MENKKTAQSQSSSSISSLKTIAILSIVVAVVAYGAYVLTADGDVDLSLVDRLELPPQSVVSLFLLASYTLDIYYDSLVCGSSIFRCPWE